MRIVQSFGYSHFWVFTLWPFLTIYEKEEAVEGVVDIRTKKYRKEDEEDELEITRRR